MVSDSDLLKLYFGCPLCLGCLLYLAYLSPRFLLNKTIDIVTDDVSKEVVNRVE